MCGYMFGYVRRQVDIFVNLGEKEILEIDLEIIDFIEILRIKRRDNKKENFIRKQL